MQHFIYFKTDKYVLSDVDYCAESERTIDVFFFDLANNENLLNLLKLYYMHGNYGVKYTFESRAKWFAGYISAFNSKDDSSMHAKLIENPIVRLLITDPDTLQKVKALLPKPNLWDKVWNDAKKEDDFDDR
jgi:hypothetical protein